MTDRTDTAAQDAAAQDMPAGHAAAVDTGQGAGEAVAVLRELLAEERRKSDSLLEASLIWEGRALQLEERLKALEAGPIADEDPPVPTASDRSAQFWSTPAGPPTTLRAWIRRLLGH